MVMKASRSEAASPGAKPNTRAKPHRARQGYAGVMEDGEGNGIVCTYFSNLYPKKKRCVIEVPISSIVSMHFL
jgi:hypothetical protein